MVEKKYKGIFTALLTPFDFEGRINDKELEKLVRFNIQRGVQGFYVCGSTAEAFLMSQEERMQVMDVVKSAAENCTLIAHIGSLNEKEAMAMGRYAKYLGYDAVSSVAPFYYKFSFKEIRDYYYRLAEESDLPMLVYHFPAFSGVSMGKDEMSEFLSDSRFLGIKYTSNDFFMMEQCKTAFPEKVLYNGFDEMFLSGLAMGADGGVGSTYNFIADKFVLIRALFDSGKIEEARAVQQRVNRIIAVLCRIGVIQAEKEVLNQLGFEFGRCRRPFGVLDAEEKELIKKEIIPYL